jgi:hypothetical protein
MRVEIVLSDGVVVQSANNDEDQTADAAIDPPTFT